MPTWSSGINLRGSPGGVGPRGTSFAVGTVAPPDDLGSNGDTYLNRASRQLYSKSNGAYAPIGLAYNTLAVGTAVPGTNFLADGDAYVRILNGQTTFWQKSGITWSQLAVLTGSDGAAGLGVLSGSGPPSSSLGVIGQPGYIDSTGLVLYGAKTASGWPAGVSIAPIKGDKGDVGPASPGLRSGSGVPSTTNPSYQIDGDYYLRTDVSPYLLYGPRVAGVFPATGQNTGGSQTQYGNGPPAPALGAQGDVYYDLTNALFYPPKQPAGWTLTPINMVGPTGLQGPTTSYRQSMRGYYWASAAVAGTAYSIATPIIINTGTANYSSIPLRESMMAAGSLTGLSVSCPGNVTASVASFSVLKNGTAIYTATSLLTCNAAATPSDAYVKLATTISFAAGDVLTMAVSFSAGTNQAVQATLFYTLNS